MNISSRNYHVLSAAKRMKSLPWIIRFLLIFVICCFLQWLLGRKQSIHLGNRFLSEILESNFNFWVEEDQRQGGGVSGQRRKTSLSYIVHIFNVSKIPAWDSFRADAALCSWWISIRLPGKKPHQRRMKNRGWCIVPREFLFPEYLHLITK